MANIDIAERLFVYAREKQQRDLANNLIKKEDIIDFSSADFNSFNQEISNMLGGMSNDQVNMFVHLLQTKMDHNITDVITPGEKGFTLNINAISSTIKQVQEQSNFITYSIPKTDLDNSNNKEQNELSPKESLLEKIFANNLKSLDELSKYGEISDEYKKYCSMNYEDRYNYYQSCSEEQKDRMHNDSMQHVNQVLIGNPYANIDFTKVIIDKMNFPKELVNKVLAQEGGKRDLDMLINDLLVQIEYDAFETMDGIDPVLFETYKEMIIQSLPEGTPLYEFIDQLTVENIQDITDMLKKDPTFRESLINDKKYQSSASYSLGKHLNKIEQLEEVKFKFNSLFRSAIGYDGVLPDIIDKQIQKMVEDNVVFNKELRTFEFKDNIDLEKLQQSFTFDIETNPELLEIVGIDPSKTNIDESIIENNKPYFAALPDTIASIFSVSMESTKQLNSLRYTEQDVQEIKPLLNQLSSTGINVSDSILCEILNESTSLKSSSVHVIVEKIVQSIQLYDENFVLDTENYDYNSIFIASTLNDIMSDKKDSLPQSLIPHFDYDYYKKFDINQFTLDDLKYDDIESYLGPRATKIKMAEAYSKLFPLKDEVDSFKYDFDAKIIKMANLSPKSQLEILTDPQKDSNYISFVRSLADLYNQNDVDISSTIDKSQQEKNLEILKEYYLEGFDKSTLDSITVDSMAPIIKALITNTLTNTATNLSDHIDLLHFEKYAEFHNFGKISIDHEHPGFLNPESYKYYKELKQKELSKNTDMLELESEVIQKSSTINDSQVEETPEDNHPTVQKKPRGLFGFISSFAKQFKETSFEDGLFNRIKKSFKYAKDSISDYSEKENTSDETKKEDFKPTQNTETNNHEQLDSFSQSLSVRNSDGSYNPDVKTESSDGDSKKHDETEIDK